MQLRSRLSLAPPCRTYNSAHVLGNTCSHGSCNANECSGASAVLAPVKTLEDEHAGVIEDRQAKELKRNLNGGNCCATQCRIPGCHKWYVESSAALV